MRAGSVMPFACARSFTETPSWAAIAPSVSPAFTTYVSGAGPFPPPPTALLAAIGDGNAAGTVAVGAFWGSVRVRGLPRLLEEPPDPQPAASTAARQMMEIR